MMNKLMCQHKECHEKAEVFCEICGWGYCMSHGQDLMYPAEEGAVCEVCMRTAIAKTEILHDLRQGIFGDAVITCFGDLQDHVDANEYGQWEEGREQVMDAAYVENVVGPVQDRLNRWIMNQDFQLIQKALRADYERRNP